MYCKLDNSEFLLQQVTELLAQASLYQNRSFIHNFYPAETSHLIESLQPEERKKISAVIPPDTMGEILVCRSCRRPDRYYRQKNLVKATEKLESDDLVDLLHSLPEPLHSKVMESIGVQEERNRLESAQSDDDHTAGGLMSLDVLSVRTDVSLTVMRYLRKRGPLCPEATVNLKFVDRRDIFQGILLLSVLLTKNPAAMVFELMDTSVYAIPYRMSAAEVALLFENPDRLSAPFIAENDKLLARITVDDIVDESGHSLMSTAELDEALDMFIPSMTSAGRRAIWLGDTLPTTFLAS